MGSGAGVMLVDGLLRRFVLPLVLIFVVVFRYNVPSLVYLLMFIVSSLLPGSLFKAHKASNLVFLGLVLAFSAIATVGQVFFQIALATDYSQQLHPCDQKESAWRQFGFALYSVPGADRVYAEDVVRHLLPDVVVFATTLLTLIFNAKVVAGLVKETKEGEEKRRREIQTGREGQTTEVGAEPVAAGSSEDADSGDSNELLDVAGGLKLEPPFPSHVQCYFKLPHFVMFLFDAGIFITLGLAGVALPSLTSFAYYAVFLTLLVVWSLHLRLRGLQRVLRCLLTFYTAVHLIVLYLYQFQSAQEHIPLDPHDTSKSVLARLFGLSAIVRTDCERPTQLLLHSSLEYPVFVSPALLLLLFWILATEFRLWLGTPRSLWKEHAVYYLPVRDMQPSSTVVCLVKGDGRLLPASGVDGDSTAKHDDVGYAEREEKGCRREGDETEPDVALGQKRTETQEKLAQGAMIVWDLLLSTSYVLAIICMMLWSVLYPSWPALVLLLWACAIWLIPKVTPRNSLYYTSPLLVLYALALLLLQYIFSLNLTTDELAPRDGLGEECLAQQCVDVVEGSESTDCSPTPGCKSYVLLIKTVFAAVFFTAFHEFVKMAKDRFRESQELSDSTDGEMPLIDMDTQGGVAEEEMAPTTPETLRAKLYHSALPLCSNYWVLLVIGAFLLVTLTGEPNLFKTIYLVFFFVFLITYQVFRRWWYYACIPVWWGLVIYAVLELLLIYTYQFESVSNVWDKAYNSTPDLTVDSEELFNSIGLRKYGVNSLQSLIVNLIPPAVFIAVMAMQLRYFKPTWTLTTPPEITMSSVDLTSLLTAALRFSSHTPPPTRDSVQVAVDVPTQEDEEGDEREGDIASQPSSLASSVAPGTPLYHCYRLTVYLLLKSKQVIVELVHMIWRFLELHVHKIAMLVLFAVALSEISVTYWVLLGLSLLVTLLPYFNPILYPLLTLYLGMLATVKTIYQFPIIQKDQFNISDDSNGTCYWTPNDTAVTGQVFHYQYSSRDGDGAWFGLHKVDNYAAYIAGPICTVLLLSFWFSARRHQASFYHSKNITIDAWENGSLFLRVARQKAERNILVACKYFINHMFEMYGVEITLVMLVIAVAVRIDVYGVFYCSVLGLLLLVPRRVMAPVWLIIITVHGLLLLLQYALLLGVPPGACFSPDGGRDYPWTDIGGQHRTALKKWLFLTDYPQILDKNILYVDFLVYVLLCLQIYNFRPSREVNTRLTDFLRTDSLMNSLKIFMTQYFFWVSLFLIFFSAVSRVSLFGLLYLLICFMFLYRGHSMLTDRQTNRKRSWVGLRLLAWVILLIRVSVQIVDCVFYDGLSKAGECALILILNGACNRRNFYGSPEPSCDSSPANEGLWVDALTFAVITVQIIIFDTQYSEMLREYLIEREEKAGYFSDVFDAKMEEKQQRAKETKEREFAELRERVEELSTREKVVDHILHAGVLIPPDVHLRLLKLQDAQTQRETELDTASMELSATMSEEPKSKRAVDGDSDGVAKKKPGKLYQLWNIVGKAFGELIDYIIVWLEESSALYVEVVEELKHQEEQAEQEEKQGETVPVKERKERAAYGSIQEVQVEVHTERKENLEMTTGDDHHIAGDASTQSPSPSPHQTSVTPEHPSQSVPSTRKTVHFDEGRDTVRSSASADDDGPIAEFEEDIEKVALKYRQRPMRFLRALRNATLAHAEYIVYFLVILNVILNGSVLSLGYACLLFGWGLLSIPWPSKTFWLAMIFYSMAVLVVKYAFQFHDIDYGPKFDPGSGLYLPHVLGIQYYKNFFSNAAWDMLLLISLLLKRGLLKQYGLWKYHRKQGAGNTFVALWYDIKRFFSRLLSPDVSLGASDYYVIMFFFDTLCLLTIVFGVSSFGVGIAGQGTEEAAEFIQTNYIPIPFVIMLLLQFLFMLVDRAIYLRRALKTKIAYQIFLLVVWHVWLLFLLPSDLITRMPFTENVAAQCIYFFKSLYFIVSAMQIVSGYPTRVLGYFIRRRYTTLSEALVRGYRFIPLLPELRSVLDWVFTDTALSIFHWLRVQEIYAQLFLVKVRRNREKGHPRALGKKQSRIKKILFGGLLLTVLVLLIWGPLLVISVINTASVANRPVAAALSLQLDGYEPLVKITVQRDSLMTLSDSEYRVFQRSFQSEVQPVFHSQFFRDDFIRAVFPNESTSLWTISPPARQSLLDTLEKVKRNNSAVALQLSWTISRESSSSLASEVVSGISSRRLTYASDQQAVDALINTLMMNDSEVFLQNLYPRLIIAPDTGPSKNFTKLSSLFRTSPNVSCTARLSSVSNSTLEWWTLNECTNVLDPSRVSGPELLIYSSRIAPPLFSAIAGLGIIGLYVSIVLVIGRFIRAYISSLPSRLAIDEIVNPDPLLKLCQDIFTVREGGDFRLEEILVGKLFAIFRSPLLTEITEHVKEKKD